MVSSDSNTPKGSASFGHYCQIRTIAGEIQQDYETLLEALRKDFNPQGVLENVFVNQMAADFWRIRRIERAEHELLTRASADSKAAPLPLLNEVEEAVYLALSGDKEARNATCDPSSRGKLSESSRRLLKRRGRPHTTAADLLLSAGEPIQKVAEIEILREDDAILTDRHGQQFLVA
jgi:hypothetical protein